MAREPKIYVHHNITFNQNRNLVVVLHQYLGLLIINNSIIWMYFENLECPTLAVDLVWASCTQIENPECPTLIVDLVQASKIYVENPECPTLVVDLVWALHVRKCTLKIRSACSCVAKMFHWRRHVKEMGHWVVEREERFRRKNERDQQSRVTETDKRRETR